MERTEPLQSAYRVRFIPRIIWWTASTVLSFGSVALLIEIAVGNLHLPLIDWLVRVFLLAGISLVALFFAAILVHLGVKQRVFAEVIESTEYQLKQMEDNIQEIFWTVDIEREQVLRVNQAYEAITGRSCRSLLEDISSCIEIIHPDDLARARARLTEGINNGTIDEKFRILDADGRLRWVWVRGFRVHDIDGRSPRLIGTVLDISSQKDAEALGRNNLAMARAASAEADALRKASLALTENLRMNHVLDTLLESVTDLISCEYAQILLLDGDARLLVAREKFFHTSAKASSRSSPMIEAAEFPFFRRIIVERESVLVPSTEQEPEWQQFQGHNAASSWLGIPLVASGKSLGVLSLGTSRANAFTPEHLRLSNSLAIPAAAAIHNARLYERASLYGSELGKRVYALDAAGKALELAEQDRKLSEQKFHKVFHASPLPFSITSAGEGRFVEVNPAFELSYGYSRRELIGRTCEELRIWENPSDRKLMITCLNRSGPIRHTIARLRTKSGKIKLTAYSADWIEFDGKTCILAMSQDLLPTEPKTAN